MARRLVGAMAVLVAIAIGLGSGYRPPGPGSPEDRRALYRELVRKTLARQAASPAKDRALGLDFARDARPLEAEFLAADTNEKLLRALSKLSNLRHDRHLQVHEVPGGIAVARVARHAAIQFLPDYGDSSRTTYFVARVADSFERWGSGSRPVPGDLLVAVNDLPVDQYRVIMDPYLRYSTRAQGEWEFAEALARWETLHGPELGPKHERAYRLERPDRTQYDVRVALANPRELSWPPIPDRSFAGFRKVLERTCYTLYEPQDERPVLLIDWRRFDMVRLGPDLDTLVAYAQRRGRLGHDVIVDATHSQGGAYADQLVRVLGERPFRGMFCSVRISDLVDELTEKAVRHYGDPSPQVEWYRGDVARAASAGLDYAPPVPLRLRGAPDGVTPPAPVHFRGRLVCLLALPGGSSLDQFAALVIDNRLAHTIGMPTGGFSNAWEWEEIVYFPKSGRPVANFTWSVGYTIRPNGEILEGNPPRPDEVVPLTRANFGDYYDDLMARALRYLDR